MKESCENAAPLSESYWFPFSLATGKPFPFSAQKEESERRELPFFSRKA